MRVVVFHNVERDSQDRPAGMLDGYKPWHRVVPVAAYDEDRTVHALSYAFELFNIGHDPDFGTPDARAVEYRQRGNRSLSVGDVVQTGDKFYACRSVGWDEIPRPDIVSTRVYGTAPIEI